MSANNKAIFAAVVLAAGILGSVGRVRSAPPETLQPLLQQNLPDVTGRTLTAVEVNFAPGAKSAPHRHGKAFLYAYVLAGSVRSQIENEPVRTYQAGENWTEKPGDHHVLTENASPTQPATLLVVFIAPTGEPLKTDDPAMER